MRLAFTYASSCILGQTVIVENRAGAGGLVGSDYVSKQPADGYTLLVYHAPVYIYATATRKVVPFDPVNDFSHIGMLVKAPMVLLVRAQMVHRRRSLWLRLGTARSSTHQHRAV